MTKPASTSKTSRKQYTLEFRDEALKLAERIDNACAESFFHTLKVECIHGERFISREIMRAMMFNYIEVITIAGGATVPRG